MLNLVILLVGVILAIGIFVGAICLQLNISKNNKRGKFVIPIIMFIMPFIVVLLVIISFLPVHQEDTKSENQIGIESVEKTPDNEVEMQDNIQDLEIESGENNILPGAIIIVIMACGMLSVPCAITTLVIELVYRSKRRRITDEEVIDIQNL